MRDRNTFLPHVSNLSGKRHTGKISHFVFKNVSVCTVNVIQVVKSELFPYCTCELQAHQEQRSSKASGGAAGTQSSSDRNSVTSAQLAGLAAPDLLGVSEGKHEGWSHCPPPFYSTHL